MSDWPELNVDLLPAGILSSADPNCSPVADFAINTAVVFSTVGAWPSANLALYIPVLVRRPLTAYQMGWVNGAGINGNIDVGIYDKAGNQLVHSGSTAQSGASVAQVVDITDTQLLPGVYYLAMASDTVTTQTLGRASMSTGALPRMCGVAQQATAMPLPGTATFAACAQSLVPIVFAAIETATL